MPKKRSKLIPITIFLIFLIIGLVIGIVMVNKLNYFVKLEEIDKADVEYYVLEKNDKYGVINKNGDIVIEAQYDGIKIPNPTTDLFICIDDINNGEWKAIDKTNTQKWTNLNSIDAISIRATTSLVPYEKTVLKYKEGNSYGIMDFEGNKITDAIYEDIKNVDYKEGYLKVKEQGLYGVINIKGKKILNSEYDEISSDGYYNEKTKYQDAGFILRIKTDNGYKYGYAKSNGQKVLDTEYSELNRLTQIEGSNSLYFIASLNGKYGLLKNSNEILKTEYRTINFDSNNKIFIAEKDSAFGVFDIDGKTIVPMDYDSIAIGGEYINAYKGENTVIFDTKGNNIQTENSSKEKVSEEYSIIIDKDNNYNIVDKNDNILLQDKYSYIEYFMNDLFIATNSTKTGLIRANGQVVIPLEYSTIQNIDGVNLLQATSLETNKTFIINSEGKMNEGLENSSFVKNENYVKLISNTDVKYYTLDGNEITYKELYPENTLYAIKQNDKWGFKDKDGKIKVNCEYDFVSEQNGNYVGVKKDGKWGVLDLNGNVVKEPSYEIAFNNVSFLGQFYEIGTNVGLPIYCGDESN